MRLIFFICLGILTCFGKQLDVQVSAGSAVLMNAETGDLLYEKYAHLPSYPASTTKIATTLYILEQKVDLDQMVVVSRESLKFRPPADWDILPPYWLDKEGAMMGLRPGEALNVNTLLHALILASANDAANALAENIGGSVPGFMDMMNKYLSELGCTNTQFSNPHGLTHPEHWTTAYDLALMMKRALEIPKFREMCATLSFKRPKTNKQPEGEIELINPLMRPKSRYYYPKAIGGKTGYTEAAQFTYVAAAEHEGRMLIAVLLGCKDRRERYLDAKKLFEVAFNEVKAKRRLIGPETIFKKEVDGIKVPLKASLVRPLSIEYFPSEEPVCKAVLHWEVDHFPIKKGQKAGEVHILSENGRFLMKGDLIAKEDVKGSLLFTLKQKLLSLFK